jgi:hypothetical protein
MFGVHSGWELIKAIKICRLVWLKIKGLVASYQMWFGQRYQLFFHAPKYVQLAASETLMCTILAFGFWWLKTALYVLPPLLKKKAYNFFQKSNDIRYLQQHDAFETHKLSSRVRLRRLAARKWSCVRLRRGQPSDPTHFGQTQTDRDIPDTLQCKPCFVKSNKFKPIEHTN